MRTLQELHHKLSIAFSSIKHCTMKRFGNLIKHVFYWLRKSTLQNTGYSGFAKQKSHAVKWNNKNIEELKSKSQIKVYAKECLGISIRTTFDNLMLEQQKAALAGMQYAATRYGKVESLSIGSFISTTLDGKFLIEDGTIEFSTTCNDAFLTGFHEYIHAIDADNSSNLNILKSDVGATCYNVYSSRVLKKARMKLGLRLNSRRYNDALLQIFDLDIKLFHAHCSECQEIAAYALEKAEFDAYSNELSKAIAKEFGND